MQKGLQWRSLAGSCCSNAFGRQGRLVAGVSAVIRVLGSAPVLNCCLLESGFGAALLEPVVGSVVGLIALFSSCDHANLPSTGASGSSLSPFRSFLSASCNTTRYLAAVDAVGRRPKNEIVQVEKEIALLDWMHSEIDWIEADCLPDA